MNGMKKKNIKLKSSSLFVCRLQNCCQSVHVLYVRRKRAAVENMDGKRKRYSLHLIKDNLAHFIILITLVFRTVIFIAVFLSISSMTVHYGIVLNFTCVITFAQKTQRNECYLIVLRPFFFSLNMISRRSDPIPFA